MEVMRNDHDLDELDTVTPADWILGPRQGDWTYETYYAMTEESVLYEVVRGVLVKKPMPDLAHQEAVGAICYELCMLIKRKQLGVALLPVDVVLSPQDVFQPDMLVVLNEHRERIQERCILGAPDLVVEVILPGSKLYDRVNKHMAYEQAGIPEYWLVDPRKQSIELFALESGKYHSLGTFSGEQMLPSRIVPQMTIPVASFFL